MYDRSKLMQVHLTFLVLNHIGPDLATHVAQDSHRDVNESCSKILGKMGSTDTGL